MKTLIQLSMVIVFCLSANAQSTPPEPPKPPKADGKYSSSIRVSKTDDDYTFKASFNKARYESVKALLIEELGKDGLKDSGSSYQWSHGNESFWCKLSKTSVRLSLDYDGASETFISHIEDLEKQLKLTITGSH